VSSNVSDSGGIVGLYEINTANISSRTYVIENCYADIEVVPYQVSHLSNTSGSSRIGGIAGRTYLNSGTASIAIKNCYSVGVISGSAAIGGIVGQAEVSIVPEGTISIENCYSSTEVNTTARTYTLIGSSTINTTGGGIVGQTVILTSVAGAIPTKTHIMLRNNTFLGNVNLPYGLEEAPETLGRVFPAMAYGIDTVTFGYSPRSYFSKPRNILKVWKFRHSKFVNPFPLRR